MSNPTPILASAVPIAISTDGITYKNVVCKKLSGLTINNTLVKDETDCGTLISTGASDISFTGEFILNTTPNGASEWGSDKVIEWVTSKTLIYIKFTSGSLYYRQMQGYLSQYGETLAQGGKVSATFTFNGSGDIDITA
jgi:hypothetical protein